MSTRQWLLTGLLALLASLVGGFAHAQAVVVNDPANSLMRCLRKGDEALVYPEQFRQLKLGGYVRVKLNFVRADQEPEVEVLSRALSEGLLETVQRYLSQYRLPCLPAGKTAVAVQEFRFSMLAAAQVSWTDLRDISDPETAGVYRCLRTPTEPLQIESPAFGMAARAKRKDVGNLLLRMRFDSVDGPPKVTIVHDSLPIEQRRAMLEYVAQYRMPCLAAVGEDAITIEQLFHFGSSESGSRMVLADMDFLKFLGAVKDIKQQKANFDFNTMACPFQVLWVAGMPIQKNRVAEVGPRNLNRTEFLAWLSGLSLNVSADVLEHVLGQTMKIDVPCTVLELGN